MKRIRQHAVLVALLITLAVFGRAAFFARHAGAQNSPAPTLQTEIAQVEARVDALEGEALTQAGQVYPGAPEAVVVLWKVLFFDKNLSVNRNTACGFCHIPETGLYAAFSPPLHYPTKPGEAKCSDCFIGGNFWDLFAKIQGRAKAKRPDGAGAAC
jgi:cytochrome c peroxidase